MVTHWKRQTRATAKADQLKAVLDYKPEKVVEPTRSDKTNHLLAVLLHSLARDVPSPFKEEAEQMSVAAEAKETPEPTSPWGHQVLRSLTDVATTTYYRDDGNQ